MTAADLRTLLDYHYWARTRLLRALAPLSADEFTAPRGSSFSSIRDTVAHTYFSEWAWYSRWQGRSPGAWPDLAQFPDVPALERAWAELEGQVRAFIDPMTDEDVQRVVTYRLWSGDEAASPVWQMVQHVVNHASYHRGQVTTMLRQAGAQPPQSMDIIAFYRKRQAASAGGR